MEAKYTNYIKEGQDYNGIHLYDVAVVRDQGDTLKVDYLTVSTVPWVTGETKFIPVNPLAANMIKDFMQQGKEVFIAKDWGLSGKEVIPMPQNLDEFRFLDEVRKITYESNKFPESIKLNENIVADIQNDFNGLKRVVDILLGEM